MGKILKYHRSTTNTPGTRLPHNNSLHQESSEPFVFAPDLFDFAPEFDLFKRAVAVVGVGCTGASIASFMEAHLGWKEVLYVVSDGVAQDRLSAQRRKKHLRDAIGCKNMLFVVGSFGDTGSADTILDAINNAKEPPYLTIGVFTLPAIFASEEEVLLVNATLATLQKAFDSVLLIPCAALDKLTNGHTDYVNPMQTALAACCQAVHMCCLENFIGGIHARPRRYCTALFGLGTGCGPQAEIEAAQHAIACPLLLSSLASADKVWMYYQGENGVRIGDQDLHSKRIVQEALHDDVSISLLAEGGEGQSVNISLIALFATVPEITRDGNIIFSE